MNSEKRREYIMSALKQTERPISASKLAKELSVSRQIIVGDVALLRASGEKVLATPRGYVIDARLTAISTPLHACTISTTWKKS